MSPAIQTAVAVFNSKVRPALRKWKYEVALVENEPNCARWELRWNDLAAYVEVRHRKRTVMDEDAIITWGSLLICGGSYCSTNDPLGISSKSLVKNFQNAVKAALVFSCKQELERIWSERIWYGSKEKVIRMVRCGTGTVDWIIKDQFYSCMLEISLSKRQPTWHWVCQSGECSPYNYYLTTICEITPTSEIMNPTEAFFRLERAIVVSELL
jgi:hypothetical protein